jgi:hypothetical protein
VKKRTEVRRMETTSRTEMAATDTMTGHLHQVVELLGGGFLVRGHDTAIVQTMDMDTMAQGADGARGAVQATTPRVARGAIRAIAPTHIISLRT